MEFQFDLQDFLEKRFAEQREDLSRLAAKVDAGFTLIDQRSIQIKADLVIHEADDLKAMADVREELIVLKSWHKNSKWLGRTMIIGVLTFLFDLAVNHVPHWFGGK